MPEILQANFLFYFTLVNLAKKKERKEGRKEVVMTHFPPIIEDGGTNVKELRWKGWPKWGNFYQGSNMKVTCSHWCS